MNLRSPGSWLALCLASAAFAACSPPAPAAPAAESDAQSPASESPAPPKPSAAATQAERRRARVSDEQPAAQFKYIDESGKLALAARIEDIPERQRSTASPLQPPAPQARSEDEYDAGRAGRNADVTIFSTKYCGYCRAAMAHFDKIGIDYVNRDVDEDDEARVEYLELTGGRRGVPVIVVGDAWIQGWSPAEFDRLLAASR